MLSSIDELDFLSKNEIGEGAYSKVYHVRHRENKKHFALKHVSLTRSMSSRFARRTVRT